MMTSSRFTIMCVCVSACGRMVAAALLSQVLNDYIYIFFCNEFFLCFVSIRSSGERAFVGTTRICVKWQCLDMLLVALVALAGSRFRFDGSSGHQQVIDRWTGDAHPARPTERHGRVLLGVAQDRVKDLFGGRFRINVLLFALPWKNKNKHEIKLKIENS